MAIPACMNKLIGSYDSPKALICEFGYATMLKTSKESVLECLFSGSSHQVQSSKHVDFLRRRIQALSVAE